MSILFLAFHMLQSFVVRVTKAVNHYLNPPELRWMADSAPTQLKNLASGQNQECFCALPVCKTLMDSQMITMADCVWYDVEALSV